MSNRSDLGDMERRQQYRSQENSWERWYEEANRQRDAKHALWCQLEYTRRWVILLLVLAICGWTVAACWIIGWFLGR